MPDTTPSGSANSRQQMRLKYPLRNIGDRVYRTSRAYTIARNSELLRGSLIRPRTLSQQVQRTLFTTPTKPESSCPQGISPKDKQPHENTTVPQTDTQKNTTEVARKGSEVNAGGVINKEKSAVGSGSGGGGDVYGKNFKKRYGGGRVQKK